MTPSTSSQTRTASVRHSLSSSNETPPATLKKTHSRNSSIVSADLFQPTNTKRLSHSRTPSSVVTMDSFIPPVPPVPLTLPVAPVMPSVPNKKLYRQSAGARLTQVKANVGLPRVRTTSITQQQQHQHKSSSTPPRESPIISTSLKSTISAATNRQTSIPLPPSQQAANQLLSAATAAASSSATAAAAAALSPESGKKSLLKPPTQRGPGSTLRLRSMLAKRGQPLPPMPVRKNSNAE